MIAPEQWARWSALLDEALDLDDAERAAWLAALRVRDSEAADAVQRLLGHEAADDPAASGTRQIFGATGSKAVGDYRQLLDDALQNSEADDSPAARPGQSFGPWQVSRPLGVGGMGEVWLATRADRLYEGQAAIKLLSTQGDTRRLGARFARERNLLARLAHPGIARLLDAGLSGDQPYLVLEYVDGLPLLDHVRARAPTVAARVTLAIAIGRAVEYAHGRLVVHRDLKPSNVMVTGAGDVKLLDFGIAGILEAEHGGDTDPAQAQDRSHDRAHDPALTRLYGGGLTLDYAAPEQIAGEPTGIACDVYALAALLFEMLAGQRPLRADRPGRAALEHAVLHVEAPRLSRLLAEPPLAGQPGARPVDAAKLGNGLDAVLAKALRKAPEDRYPTMSAFIADLDAWLEHRPLSVMPPSLHQRGRLWLRRNPRVALLTAAATLSLIGGISVSLWQWRDAREQAARATAVSGFMADLFRAADPERTRGDRLSARDLVDAGAERLTASGIDDPGIKAQLGAALGNTYVSLSRPDKALPVLARAVDDAIRAHGPDAPETAQLQLLLVKAEFQNEQYDAVINRCEAAVAILEAAGQLTREDVILSRNLWAYSLAKQGNFERADAVIAATLQRVRRTLGEQHWLYVETINDTATLATIRGEWASARELLGSIRQQMLTPPQGHRQDALTMRLNLANAFSRTGAIDDALSILRPVVADYTALLGADANQTLVARWFLADTLKRSGRYDECVSEYAALAGQRKRISGERHVLTVDVIAKQAMCERLLGHDQQSRALARQAASLLTESDDPPQRTVLRIASTLAALAFDGGNVAAAKPLLARVGHLLDALNLGGRDDMIWFAVMTSQAQLLAGSPEAALAGFRAAHDRAPTSMDSVVPAAWLAYLLALNGQRDAAEAQVLKLRPLVDAKLGTSHWLHRSLDYVDALAAGDVPRQTRSLERLGDRPTPPAISLPLSPIWFGLI